MNASNSNSAVNSQVAIQHISKTLEVDLIRQGWSPEQAKALLQKVLAAKSSSAIQAGLKRVMALMADPEASRLAADVALSTEDTASTTIASNTQLELFPTPAAAQDAVQSVVQFDQQLAELNQHPTSLWAQAAAATTTGVATDAAAAGAASATSTAAASSVAAGLTAGQIVAGVVGVAAVAGGAGGKAAAATPPAKPSLSLTTDTGFNATDRITSDGHLSVSNLDSSATVEYKLNNGAWTSTFSPDRGQNKVIVRQTKGGLSSSSDEFIFTYDPVAPTTDAVVMTVDRTAKTVTLTFQEDLDGTNKPGASDFVISTMNGGTSQLNAVTTSGIAISGRSITLTLTDTFTAGQVSVVYTKGAGTTNVLQDIAGNDVVNFFSGVAADGYLRGASVLVNDVDTGIKTQADGTFFLPAYLAISGPITITITGGVNIDTGIANTVDLKAPAMDPANLNKPMLINPLTTLIQTIIDQAPAGTITAATAAASVAASLGLPAGTDLLTYDPIAVLASDPTSTAALSAQKSAAQVVAVVGLVARGDASASDAVMEAIASQMSTAASTGSSVNLADSGTLTNILFTASTGNSTITATLSNGSVASNLSDALTSISTSNDLASISANQSKFLDTVAPLVKTITVAANTNDTAPDITITFDNTDTTGKAAMAGDKLVLMDGGVKIGSVITLTDAQIAAGRVVVTDVILSEGSHNLTAQLADVNGNASTTTSGTDVAIDTKAPDVTIRAADATVAGHKTLSFTFSEAVSGFTKEDITVPSGGTLGTLSAATTDSGSGSVKYTIDYTPPSSGAGTISVAAGSYTDTAGNSGTGNSLALTGTYTPQVSIKKIGGADGLVSSDTQDAYVSGLGEPSLAVILRSGDTILNPTTPVVANEMGVWTYQLSSANLTTLGQGAVSITATQTKDGIPGTSAAFNFTVDTAGPASLAFSNAIDTNISAADKAQTNGVVVNGTVDGATAVQLTLTQGSATVSRTANLTGNNWTYTLTEADYKALGQGAVTVSATAKDLAGNATTQSGPTINIDTVAPTLFGLALTDATDTGIKGDNRTNNATPSLQFTAEAGSLISVDPGTGYVARGTATGSIQTITAPTLTEGEKTIKIKAVDTAGNETIRTVTVTLDATAPTITAVTDSTSANVTKEAVTFTANFSEAVFGTLGTSSFTATNGTVSSVTRVGTTNNYTVVVTPTAGVANGNVALSLVGNGLTDATGNAVANANLSNLDSQGIDTKAPAIATVTDATTASLTKDAITFTATFDEAVVGTVSNTSFTATNGAVTSVERVGTSNVYTVVVTPTPGLASGNVALSLVGTGLTDAVGNAVASASLSTLDSQGIDTKPPAITSVSDATTASVTKDAITFTATFDEAVVGTVSTSSFTATNGTVSSVSQVGTSNVYTVVVTPTAGTASGNVALSLVGTGLTDATGNAVASASLSTLDSQAIDTKAPAITTVTDATTASVTKDAITFTATFDEAVVGTVSASSFTATNGVVTSVTQLGTTNAYTIVVTPTAGLASGNVALSLVGTGLTDSAGNTVASASLSTLDSQGIDTKAPVITTVTDTTTATVTKDAITFTATFDEAVVGTFSTSSFTATNGTVTSVAQVGTSNAYTVTVTPNAGTASGNVSLSLVGTGLTDSAGNAVSSANLSGLDSQAVDTVAPTKSITTPFSSPANGDINVGSKVITLTFNEAVKAGSGNIVISTQGAADQNIDVTSSSVTFNGAVASITANLAPSLTYSVRFASGVILDSAGNAYAGITSADPLSFTMASNPTVTITSDDVMLKIGDTAHLSFVLSQAPVTALTLNDITVTGLVGMVGNGGGTLSNFAQGSDTSHYTASFTPAAGIASADLLVSVAAEKFSNADGLKNAASAVTTLHIDTVAPAAPTISLLHDTGTAGDKITNDATIAPPSEQGASYEYSSNGTSGWSTTAPTPAQDANTVYVRQLDAVGNTSTATAFTFTFDNAAAKPTVSLLHDTGLSSSDKVTSDATFTIGGRETDATLSYSTDGSSWASTFTPVSGNNTVYVKQTDITGNTSSASDAFTFIFDQNDSFAGTSSNNSITGFAGNDSITGQAGNDTISGLAGNDTIDGGTGADLITGGAGADVIDLGGSSSGSDTSIDTLKLLAASDSTVAAPDVISHFAVNQDIIDLSSLLGSSGAGYTQSSLASSGATSPFYFGNSPTDWEASSDRNGNYITVKLYTRVDLFANAATTNDGAVMAFDVDTSQLKAGNSIAVQDNAFGIGSASGSLVALLAEFDQQKIFAGDLIAKIKFTLNTGVTASNFVASISNIVYELNGTGIQYHPDAPYAHNQSGDIIPAAANGTLMYSFSDVFSAPSDNELHISQDSAGHLQMQYDTNPTAGAGQTTLSSIIQLNGFNTGVLTHSNFYGIDNTHVL